MRVLLAEDETRIADFILRGLSEEGYAVDVATDGEEAIGWPDVAEFDAIILDIMLPIKDGTGAMGVSLALSIAGVEFGVVRPLQVNGLALHSEHHSRRC